MTCEPNKKNEINTNVYRRVLCIDYISDNLCNLVRNVMNLISNVCKT